MQARYPARRMRFRSGMEVSVEYRLKFLSQEERVRLVNRGAIVASLHCRATRRWQYEACDGTVFAREVDVNGKRKLIFLEH